MNTTLFFITSTHPTPLAYEVHNSRESAQEVIDAMHDRFKDRQSAEASLNEVGKSAEDILDMDSLVTAFGGVAITEVAADEDALTDFFVAHSMSQRLTVQTFIVPPVLKFNEDSSGVSSYMLLDDAYQIYNIYGPIMGGMPNIGGTN